MDLSDYRREIDNIDSELVKLLEKRMNMSVKVAEYKIANGMEVFNGAREAEVIQKNVSRLENKEYEIYTEKFFNYIMELSRSLQHKLINTSKSTDTTEGVIETIKKGRLGFPGVEGSFSEEALIKYFGENEKASHYERFEEVFNALKNEEIDYAVVPVENSSTGAVTEIYDLMNKYGFYIVGEQCIKIEQHLIGIEGCTLDSIKEVYSHEQGIKQSTNFLKNNKEWSLIPYHNTAVSVKLISDLKDISKAAIGSRRAAELYGLNIIKENINNESQNSTRFLIISKDLAVDDSCNKVSIIFSLDDEVGTLYSLLRHFAENNINLKKIESRPIKNSLWKYLLYLDFNGNINDVEVKNALDIIQKSSHYYKLLGNYKNFI